MLKHAAAVKRPSGNANAVASPSITSTFVLAKRVFNDDAGNPAMEYRLTDSGFAALEHYRFQEEWETEDFDS